MPFQPGIGRVPGIVVAAIEGAENKRRPLAGLPRQPGPGGEIQGGVDEWIRPVQLPAVLGLEWFQDAGKSELVIFRIESRVGLSRPFVIRGAQIASDQTVPVEFLQGKTIDSYPP